MDINEFVVKFASVFDDADPAEFSAETKYKDMAGWDSLTVMSLIALLSGEYGVTMSVIDMDQCNTVADVYKLFEKSK